VKKAEEKDAFLIGASKARNLDKVKELLEHRASTEAVDWLGL